MRTPSRQLLAVLIALAAAGCVSELDVRRTGPGAPRGGLLYRLPVPQVRITETRYPARTAEGKPAGEDY